MNRSLPSLFVGILLVAICWQLSALLAPAPDEVSVLGSLLLLGGLAAGWLVLVLLGACLLRGPRR